MQLLLDTHIALWAVTDDARLSRKAKGLIGDQDNRVFVSTVNVWEVAIKRALRRKALSVSGADVLGYFRGAGYDVLDVTPEHAVGVEGLPMIHNDPFDRMLVAQALTEPLRLVTHDQTVAEYSDTIILA